MPPYTAPSPAAVRTRHYRERRERGDIVVPLEVENYKLDALVEHGFLEEGDLKNRAKVGEAVGVLLFFLADGAVELDHGKYE